MTLGGRDPYCAWQGVYQHSSMYPQDVCLNLITTPSCGHQNLLWTMLEILWDVIPLHLRIGHLDVFSSKQLCVHVE